MTENDRISAGAEKVEKIDRGGAERADEAKSKIAKEEACAEKRIENAKMKAEKEEKKRVRAEREHAEKMHERAERAERTVARRREKQRGEDKHAPGFGGWLAAVVALSVFRSQRGEGLHCGRVSERRIRIFRTGRKYGCESRQSARCGRRI